MLGKAAPAVRAGSGKGEGEQIAQRPRQEQEPGDAGHRQLQGEVDKADQFFKGLSMQTLLGQAQASAEGGEKLPIKSEAELYAALELPFIPPELREDQGEFEAAAAGDRFEDLIERVFEP